MANGIHLEQLLRGVAEWNEWVRIQRIRTQGTPLRHEGSNIGVSGFYADLNSADLSGIDLYQGQPGAGWSGIDLLGADLRHARLQETNLAWANLTGATLAGADLSNASLMNATLDGCNLAGANLSGAKLGGGSLLRSNLRGANLQGCYLYSTNFSDTDFTDAIGLNMCEFAGPCTIDHRTLFQYASVPEVFLRGCGLPEKLIQYLPSIREEAISVYSCFISYAHKDAEFVQRLHADLQIAGVRCWLDEHDLLIGDKMLDRIYEEIRVRDKVLIVLSKDSVESSWVEDEVTRAFGEERNRNTPVLLPVRIDNAVMQTQRAWALKIKESRHIGDFGSWADPCQYRKSFSKLMRSLHTHSSSSQ